MRQIVLDTETTGLEFKQGHRIIEIGCVELNNRRKTENYFHQYINPERDIDDGAFEVHGISNESLKDKPVFRDIASEFIEFIRGGELIIHNAQFDVGFINNELELLGPEWGKVEDYCQVIDTLLMAREKHPGQKNSLDALCQRYNVDNSQRELHGALLDAQILIDVYLAMTGGQVSLVLGEEASDKNHKDNHIRQINRDRNSLRIIEPDSSELAAHHKRMEKIRVNCGGTSVWDKLNNPGT